MKFCFSIFLLLLFISCKDEKQPSQDSSYYEDYSNKKNKRWIESERDVETQDSSIQVDPTDLELIRIRIYPSFAQDHAITYSTLDRKLSFYQISQKLNRTEDYYKIPEEEREYHLYQFMKKNSSKNFHQEITPKEEQIILKYWAEFKKAKYQFKNIEQMDGAEFYTSIYERDTIVYVNTNSPSNHQTKLLKTLFDLCEKYAQDSITKRNINDLKEYL
jgi:dissimilatory sulfite reductase (desulfoviridin) alpha/beta subunit